jgi:DNA-binding MarR family transcriptional regulator
LNKDVVDIIQAQWRIERPDVDCTPVGVIGRVSRLSRVVERELKALFAEYGLESWEFDVLATLRRSGPSYRLPMGGLLPATLVTSGALTNRVDRLEAKGLVFRAPAGGDRRSVEVGLTDEGRSLVDEILPRHMANERRLLAVLPAADRAALADALRTLLVALGDSPSS